MAKRRKLTCSSFIRLNGANPADARARLAERDERARLDTRTEIQRWLNDPPPGRSALATADLSRARSNGQIEQQIGRVNINLAIIFAWCPRK
jgi:hypothetical protein